MKSFLGTLLFISEIDDELLTAIENAEYGVKS